MARKVPQDTGWSWVVMFGTFICMFFVVGMFRSQGILFVEFIRVFGSSQAVSAVMVGVTACGLSLVSPFANHFAVLYSSRVVVMVGSLMCATGALLGAWSPNIYFVIGVFGVLTGCGYSCMFGPSLMMIGLYFEKRRSLANATALAGASVGCLIIPPIMTYLVEQYTVWGALIIYSAFVLNGCVAGMLLRPPSFYTSGINCRQVQAIPTKETETSDLGNQEKPALDSCDIHVSPAESNASLNSHKCVHHTLDRVKTEGCQKSSSSCSKLTKSTEVNIGGPSGDECVAGNRGSAFSKNSIEKCKDCSHHIGSTKSLDRVKSSVKKTHFENKSIALLRRVDDHYTSKDSLFLVEGQEIPNAMVQEELKLYQQEHHLSNASLKSTTNDKSCTSRFHMPACLCKFFEWHHCSNPLFIIYCISVGIGNSAYVDHFIVIPPHCDDLGFSKNDAAMLLSIAGGLDVLGRLLAGWFADLNLVKRWRIMSIAMMTTGVSTAICSYFNVFSSLVVLSVVLGFVSGIQIATFTVVLLDFVGLAKFPGAFGIFMLFMGIFNSGLPSFLGFLRDMTGSHHASFLTVGVLMVFSGSVLWLEPCARRWQEKKHQKMEQASSIREVKSA